MKEAEPTNWSIFLDKVKVVLFYGVLGVCLGLTVDFIWIHGVYRMVSIPIVFRFFIIFLVAQLLIEMALWIDWRTTMICRHPFDHGEKPQTTIPHLVPILHFGWLVILCHTRLTTHVIEYVTNRIL